MAMRASIAPMIASGMVVMAALGPADRAAAEPPASMDPSTARVAAADATSRFVALGIGKSVVIDLPRDVKDVLVANPTIANAVVRSARRAYLIGVTVGQTNVFFFDADGRQIAGYDIAVTRDLNGVRGAIKQVLPQADVHIEGLGDGVVLTGSVASAAEGQQAVDLATRLVGEGKVVNSLIIRGRDQVMLKVMVAEVNRNVIKQLGVDLNANLGYGATALNLTTANPFSINGPPPNSITGTFKGVSATVNAMEAAGVLHMLAEPNLTAISGESANFLAGGEFPIPAGFTCTPGTNQCTTGVQYKKFGVGLNFTPVVLAEGRISLKVMSEVSEVTNDNSLALEQPVGNGNTFQTVTIPAIKTRRAETTIELPSGGSLAMAGLIQQETKQQISGLPGLMELPVLGTLFKSRDYLNNTTELMVIVTPYVVHAVAGKELSRPDDGFADAPDPSSVLLGRLNRIYGTAGHLDPHRSYFGNYGFILD